ncbi:hypothetical protein H9L14_12575 [Sphingomonas sediminicola]|uniref:LPXTG cell wall anchor domain-containing protein n=1 Tax=Sphingomonas sediminicola TaxID=386874 RepID=A0ABX6T6C1_9SPHN|nr:hypothetical protein [Sphingomonas sediminicola]QNP45412.1 hypothetical protein H9L14_12575 [Sphingomonas sediminicola]
MMYTRKQYRLGTTAIAAVLALSSTSLAAQEVPSTETAPVEATAAAPEPAAPAADPLAPAAEPEATSTPVETTTAAKPEAAPAAKPVAKKTAAKTVRSAPKAAAAPVDAPASEPIAEVAPAPVPITSVEPAPAVAPVAEVEPAKDAELKEALPIAGGAGALILALAGAGMAVRRKRRREDDEFEHNWIDNDELALTDPVQAEPEAGWDPPVHQPVAATMPAAMEPTEVPDRFDTSDFGRHVRAAYQGPTTENPSLSLRKRLKIAGELDRRERLGLAPKPTAVTKPVVAAKPEKMAISFGGTASKAKVHEYQF